MMDNLQTSSTLSWILTELLEKEEDFISIICKEGMEFRTSGLLLAAVSPLVSDLMKSVDFQNCVLHLPDIEIKSVQNIFDRVYSFAFAKDQPVSIEWYNDPLHQLFSSKSGDENLIILDAIKEEVEPGDIFGDDNLNVDFYRIKYEGYDEITVGVDNKEFIARDKLQWFNKVEDDRKPVSASLKTDHSEFVERMKAAKLKKKRGRKIKEKIEKKNIKRAKLNIQKIKEEEEFSTEGEREISTCEKLLPDPERKQREAVKKRKRIVDSDCDSFEDSEDDFKVATDNNSEDENDSDNEEDPADEEDNENKPVVGKNRKQSKKIREEDLPKDEEYVNSHQKLKQMLEDTTHDEDPWKFWCQMNGVGFGRHKRMDDKFQYICPLCLVIFSDRKVVSGQANRAFANHIQKHKLQTFKCTCNSISNGELKKAVRYRHIKLEHWKWVDCEHCHTPIFAERYDYHLYRKHPKFANVACEFCGKKFVSKTTIEFLLHISYHKAESFICDCSLQFKSTKQKVHHMQSQHLKELVCCPKCHFMTSGSFLLDKHIKNTHLVVKSPCICEQCGLSFPDKHQQKSHMDRVHDPVLLLCPKCPRKYNKAALKVHIEQAHSKGGICNLCGAQVSYLKRHMKCMHTPNHLKKYPCSDCDKAFITPGPLRNHQMSVHLKLRPYNCRYGCEFAYNDLGNRNAHERKKHGKVFSSKGQEGIKDE